VKALRARVEAPTASFRYPTFVVGRQPSYPAPPPATVRGLLACALGELTCPRSYEVAIRFGAKARVDDLELQHVLVPAGGKMPGTSLSKTAEGSVQPVRREFFLDCWLELIVRGGDLERLAAALRRPAFPLTLGRSQDLATTTSIEDVEVEQDEKCYVEDALVPGLFRNRLHRGLGLVLPVEVGAPPWREPLFGHVVWVEGRAHLDAEALVEVASPGWGGRRRGALFFGTG
jgi:CRISPR-associated protein Cas5t